MITVLDMETGAILDSQNLAYTPDCRTEAFDPVHACPQLALAQVETEQPANRMPPDMATLDIAEILDSFR